MKFPKYALSPALRYFDPTTDKPRRVETDVCIYGATPAGIGAALQAHKMGLSVALLEHSSHVGGMTTSGLGQTDFGNKAAVGGLALDFYRKMGAHYEQEAAWHFEPHVAENTFHCLLDEAGVEPLVQRPLKSVRKDGARITQIETENGDEFRAKIWVDASYEGDLMARAGCSFHVGREANSQYHETLNGVNFRHPNHNFNVWVDPYKNQGDPDSGLCWGITHDEVGELESGDKCVQGYNFRMCLTDVATNRLPFPKPNGYDANRYELLRRAIKAGQWDVWKLNKRMPNGKSDHNNFGGFATDYVGGNYDWPDGDYARREEIFQDHVSYQAGMFWFLANDKALPDYVRDEVNEWGLPRDEFEKTGGWPHQLYVREARRLVSEVVMTERHCRGLETVEDGIALGAYNMDSHNCRRVVIGGRVVNEGNIEIGGFPPYPVSYRAMVPRKSECENLLVPVCLSASHIAFGSIRMEPVFMVLGQSAATAAALAIEEKCALQDVNYPALRAQLEKDGQVLQWK